MVPGFNRPRFLFLFSFTNCGTWVYESGGLTYSSPHTERMGGLKLQTTSIGRQAVMISELAPGLLFRYALR
jgi:hypothetical protein